MSSGTEKIKVELELVGKDTAYRGGVLIRKFFNMCFFNSNRKEMHMYTAIAFGGIQAEENINEDKGTIITSSDKDPCELDFKVSLEDAESSYIDYSDRLIDQFNELRHVWGGEENHIHLNSISLVAEKMKEVFGDENIKKEDNGYTIAEKQLPTDVYFFTEKGNSFHDCFLRKGNVAINRSEGKVTLISEKNIAGVESLVWVYTCLRERGKKRLFEPNNDIEFELCFKGSKFITPDLTWYIAPPEGYEVDTDNANLTATIGGTKISGMHNLINPVSSSTTVKFEEWVKNENIGNRKKSRLLLSELTSKGYKGSFSDDDGLIMKVRFSVNNTVAEFKQFLAGIILSFLLTFFTSSEIMSEIFDGVPWEIERLNLSRLVLCMNALEICLAVCCFFYNYKVQNVNVGMRIPRLIAVYGTAVMQIGWLVLSVLRFSETGCLAGTLNVFCVGDIVIIVDELFFIICCLCTHKPLPFFE